MSIIGKKRILALAAALLLILGALVPAMAESGAAAEDKLYAAIDEAGYAYVTAAEATIFYADESLSTESRCGFLRKKVTLLATAYTAQDAVQVWLKQDGEVESVYIARASVKNPQKESNIVSQAEKAGLTPVEMECGSVYVHDASIKPLVNSAFQQWFIDLAEDFYKNIIEYDRWLLLLQGLGNTMVMTAGALLIGVVIGIVIAVTRSVWETNGSKMRPGMGKVLLRALDGFFHVYTTIFRGTPMMVQLLIMGFVIFASSRNYTFVGALTLGINSGAYVAEIIRGGLMSLDPGQMEAGRSLGLGYGKTMRFIVIPQAFKAILPSLGNEFIILLKDTSLITVIGGKELVYAAQAIYGRTYEQMYPLIGVACVYLVLVMIFTWLVGILERRLRQSDRR